MALSAAVAGMGQDWDERFLATRGLIARTPALREHSVLSSMLVQERLVEVLEIKLGIDSRTDVRQPLPDRTLTRRPACRWTSRPRS